MDKREGKGYRLHTQAGRDWRVDKFIVCGTQCTLAGYIPGTEAWFRCFSRCWDGN